MRWLALLGMTVAFVAAGCGGDLNDAQTDTTAQADTTASDPTKPKVLASERSDTSGNYETVAASVDVDTTGVGALYWRGYGRDLSGFATAACTSRETAQLTSRTRLTRTGRGRLKSGTLYRLKQPFPGDCFAFATLDGSGRLKVEIIGCFTAACRRRVEKSAAFSEATPTASGAPAKKSHPFCFTLLTGRVFIAGGFIDPGSVSQDGLAELADAAPKEIRADIETLAQALATLAEKVGDDPDPFQLEAALQSLSPKTEAADEHLDAWEKGNCKGQRSAK